MTPSETERHRHRCEVRECIRMGFQAFREWFAGDPDRKTPSVAKVRGEEAARRLWLDVKQQASLGNTGRPGEWIDPIEQCKEIA